MRSLLFAIAAVAVAVAAAGGSGAPEPSPPHPKDRPESASPGIDQTLPSPSPDRCSLVTSHSLACLLAQHSSGVVRDTCCQYDTASAVNARLLPILDDLVKTTVFRYFKVNLNRDCPFWNEEMLCVLRDCSVIEAEESEIPSQWRQEALSAVDWTVKRQGLNSVAKCEISEHDFCLVEDDLSQDGRYVNLVKNPERYTGYRGESAARVWGAIYNENCFDLPNTMGGQTSGLDRNADDVCTEKRAFYKLISGLHSSISIHICDEYLDVKTGQWVRPLFSIPTGLKSILRDQGPNLKCYIERIADFPERLENLYFIWSVATRAISKLAPYLLSHPFCDGTKDAELVKSHVDQVAKTVLACPSTFDEKALFAQAPYQDLKLQFKQHFRNISRIMDCVGCEKCRLWGKLQITGLGTALKILFSFGDDPKEYRLTRGELVALINGYHRLSESVEAVERFKRMIEKESQQQGKESGHDELKRRDIEDKKTTSGGMFAQKQQERNQPRDTDKSAAKSSADDAITALTAEYLLAYTSIIEPRRYIMYTVGTIVFVLGLVRVLQLGYNKNLKEVLNNVKNNRVEKVRKGNDRQEEQSDDGDSEGQDGDDHEKKSK